MREKLGAYFDTLFNATRRTECTDLAGASMTIDAASDLICDLCHAAHKNGGKVIFIGNGGSMGIATHMAVDFSKAGGIRAIALGDGATLTCIGNDFGFHDVFSRQIEWHGHACDVLIAISSSGKSPDILNGVSAARSRGAKIVTFSGFGDDNPLRRAGDVNCYVRAQQYGFVEVAHQAILHAILDIDVGWKSEH
jgi:D-sedoheptulose 7-phosphate isomerase